MLSYWLFLVLLLFFLGGGALSHPNNSASHRTELQVAWLSYSHTTEKRHSNKKNRA